jgi:tRNA pseudouridine38-40 synthase
MRIRLTLAYDGTAYLGWQKTKMGPSIEEALESTLRRLLQEDIQLEAASRTDAGVHARGQIACFHTSKTFPLGKLQHALNGLLPKDISILKIEEVTDDFHPTLHAQGKEYHYHICLGKVQLPFFRSRSWHFTPPLNLSSMQEASGALVGTHDFAAFCNNRYGLPSDTIRSVTAINFQPVNPERLIIIVKGKSFLYKMVRNIVGTLVYVGCGKLTPDSIPLILNEKKRPLAGITAPAHGLILDSVYY